MPECTKSKELRFAGDLQYFPICECHGLLAPFKLPHSILPALQQCLRWEGVPPAYISKLWIWQACTCWKVSQSHSKCLMDNDLPLFDFFYLLCIPFTTGIYDDKEFIPWGMKIPLLNMFFNLKKVRVEYFDGRHFLCVCVCDFIYLYKIPLGAFQGNCRQLGPVWRKKEPTHPIQLSSKLCLRPLTPARAAEEGLRHGRKPVRCVTCAAEASREGRCARGLQGDPARERSPGSPG